MLIHNSGRFSCGERTNGREAPITHTRGASGIQHNGNMQETRNGKCWQSNGSRNNINSCNSHTWRSAPLACGMQPTKSPPPPAALTTHLEQQTTLYSC